MDGSPQSGAFRRNHPCAVTDVQATASAMGQQLEILTATTNRDIRPAFDIAVRKRTDALLIIAEPLFANRLVQLATLASRHAMPAIFPPSRICRGRRADE